MKENQIIQILAEHKTLTGKELRDKTHLDELTLWRLCSLSQEIVLNIIGRRFLRLDRKVQGFARLSPSIKREFLTYTICGLKKNSEEIQKRSESLGQEIMEISRNKHNLARNIISEVVEFSENRNEIQQGVCFIIAGDIVYDMAHLEPRPERSTGELVRGSDLDIIIVTDNRFPRSIGEKLDRDIHREKYLYLIDPDYREEIDYIVKNISRAEEQLKFDKFESMVASKILLEGQLLYGSNRLFDQIKKMLKESRIPEKIAELEEKAVWYRREAESYFLKGTGKLMEEERLKLFCTEDESEEIF